MKTRQALALAVAVLACMALPSEASAASVAAANQPPLVGEVSVVLSPGPDRIRLSGIDPEGEALQYAIVTRPSHGSIPAALDGAYVDYTPDAGYFGSDSFTYRVTDAQGASANGTVDIVVQGSAAPSCEGRSATIVMQSGQQVVFGTNGPDVIVGTSSADRIYGLGGDDVICGSGGNDLVYGGPGADRILAEDGNDTVYGCDGADSIVDGTGNDLMYGGNGADLLASAEGNDGLYGGAGPDVLRSTAGFDTLSGGDDNDTLNSTGAETVNLWGGNGLDTLITAAGTSHH